LYIEIVKFYLVVC